MTINAMVLSAKDQIKQGQRFAFGHNWHNYLSLLDNERIDEAVKSLSSMLGMDDLSGKTFLDIGSGSGLFSLAARRMGATVHSFDFDEQSVNCTQSLRERFYKDDPQWQVSQGSVLDKEFLKKFAPADIVYSWGVLHHTGSMWEALENVAPLVKPDGKLFISIYNDQGGRSKRWYKLKKAYNQYNALQPIILAYGAVRLWLKIFILDALKGDVLRTWKNYKSTRGMSAWYDIVDWIGGYPFEVATPAEIFRFYRERGFILEAMTTQYGHGCNEFVFRKRAV